MEVNLRNEKENYEKESPEAKLGRRVEDLWEDQDIQLNPSDKLNSCFESIPVSSFPLASASHVEIRSDCSLAEAVSILSQNKILNAPVVDVNAPQDATWIEKYIGIVEFAGIAVWILHQSEDELNRVIPFPKSDNCVDAVSSNAVNQATKIDNISSESAVLTPGNFFEALTNSDLYKKTTYKLKSVPVVSGAKIENIITQSAVIHMLAECAGFDWFENLGTKKLTEIGLPLMRSKHVIKVYEDEPVLQAFKLMRQKHVGGVSIIERQGEKAVGNISIRDVQFLLTVPEIYNDCRSITAKDFLSASQKYKDKHSEGETPAVSGMLACKKDDTLKKVIMTLDSLKIQRIYVSNESGSLEGVITLRDIISRLVYEPHNYFGDFFDGAIPNDSNTAIG